jgi:formylglycine-generating enzyme required for sulfatase activity
MDEMLRARHLALAATALAGGACAALVGVEDVQYGGEPADAGGETSEGAASDAGLDGGDSSLDGADAREASRCPGKAGPLMVDIGPFCIDSTEVTVGHYRAFLLDSPSTSLQPPFCDWNSYTPDPWPQAPNTLPVSGVTWCDAYAYCAWAGKRLCGAIDGGSVVFTDQTETDPNGDQWYRACSHGAHAYPYGDTYDPSACNGPERDAGPLPVASLSGCQGGYPGLFDMVGNVAEWEDSCGSTDAGRMDTCAIRGGSFLSPSGVEQQCGFLGNVEDREFMGDVGIRCCAP